MLRLVNNNRNIMTALVVINILIIVFAAYHLVGSRNNSKHLASISTQNLAQALKGDIGGDIQLVDVTLQTIVDEIARLKRHNIFLAENIDTYLERPKSRLSVDILRIADASGDVLYGVSENVHLNINDRDFFNELKNNPTAGLVISKPLLGKLSNKWTIFLARRLNNSDGSFAGIVYAGYLLESFEKRLSQLKIGSHSVVVLRDADMRFITRFPPYPDNGASIGKQNISKELRTLIETGADSGTTQVFAPSDKMKRMNSFARIKPYPLIIIVGFGFEDFLSNWQDEAKIVTCFVLIFAMITSLATWLLVRERSSLILAQEQLRKDIEHRKTIEGELASARDAAESSSQAKSEFLANMSHEIRTPMNGVIGMTGLLLDSGLNPEQRNYAETVRSSGESLLTLINDILDFSKIEAGKLDLEELDFDLSSLLEDFAATMAVRAHEKGVELICAADPDVPDLLRGDPGRLRQILNNLTGNAIKFTNEGEVAIRITVADSVGDSDRGIMLQFSVRDTGIGIPKNKVSLLFNKFSQVDTTTTRLYGGTGLGLAISKQLAELMGGEVGVNSEEGCGSEFWFTVRIKKQPEALQPEPPASADLNGVKVLIVADNATSRNFLEIRLASWGMRPTNVTDGKGALQSMHTAVDENDPFLLAVIDLQKSDMDGIALGRAIMADQLFAATRMVMLASLGYRGNAKQFADCGFAGYLTKPVRHRELRTVLSLTLATQANVETKPSIVTRHTAMESLPQFNDCAARILLVEDNIVNQKVALGIIKKLGLTADAVANGKEAITALEDIPYDLVFMDCQMPVMDGFEATRAIRDSRSTVRNNQIPIIAMTANAMQGDREKCLETGMNDYVAKPVNRKALAELLEKWLHVEKT